MILIRSAELQDLPSILAIYNDAVVNTTATAEYYPNTLDMRRQWYGEHQQAGLPVLVAESEDGQVVGWSSLSRFHARYGYRFTVEDSVYIAESWRGRGIGRQLVAPLLQGAHDLGLHTIIASIDSENLASIRLHRSLGFVQTGFLKEVINKFGRWLDCVYLQFSVTSPPAPEL
jgi:L-amino acid N-acyltransferase YncA